MRRRSRAKLDDAIDRYYRALGATEREEDEAWASLGDEAVRRAWGE